MFCSSLLLPGSQSEFDIGWNSSQSEFDIGWNGSQSEFDIGWNGSQSEFDIGWNGSQSEFDIGWNIRNFYILLGCQKIWSDSQTSEEKFSCYVQLKHNRLLPVKGLSCFMYLEFSWYISTVWAQRVFRNFMFCWLCISICTCNETNLMHYLPSVYSVTILLHVSGLLVAHHQEVTTYVCDNCYVLYVLVDCRQAQRQSTKTHNTYQLSHIYIVTSWWWATSKPETCRVVVTEWTEDKQCIRFVSLQAQMFIKQDHNMSAVHWIYDAVSWAVVTAPSISTVLRSDLSKMVTFLWGDIIR
jgi:hypothetical protein